jgi:hypothetical protein
MPAPPRTLTEHLAAMDAATKRQADALRELARWAEEKGNLQMAAKLMKAAAASMQAAVAILEADLLATAGESLGWWEPGVTPLDEALADRPAEGEA